MKDDKYTVISVEDELPTDDGKYIVFTKTMMGNKNTLEIHFHWQGKGKKRKPRWGCTNQVVTHWFKKS